MMNRDDKDLCKFSFILARTDEFMMIRRCALEDMNSQCGRFKFAVIFYFAHFMFDWSVDWSVLNSVLSVSVSLFYD